MSPEERQRIRNAAAALLEAKGWTRGTLARNKWGHSVEPLKPSAAKFCMLGACERVAGRKLFWSDLGLEKGSFPAWNDTRGRTKAEVIAFLRSGKDRPDAEEGA